MWGTRDGELDCELKNTVFKLYCEGGSVSGVGDKTGKGDVTAQSCQFDVMFLQAMAGGLKSEWYAFSSRL